MSASQIDVVVAGHVCMDITPTFGRLSGASIGDILRPGHLVRTLGVGINPGGTVGNTGPALHRLGLRVALMGKCGQDPFGRMLLDALRELAPGAEAGMQVVEGEKTSYTIVLAPPGIDRMFLHCPGANDTFGPEDVDRDVVRRARLFHFGYPPLMRRMYSAGGAEAEQLLNSVRALGVVTSLDMSLPDPESEAGRADWPALLARMLPHTDLFLPSLDELVFMLDRPRFAAMSEAGRSAADAVDAAQLRSLAERCLEMGAQLVVVKCGHAGVYMRTGEPQGPLAGLLERPEDWRGLELFEPACRARTVVSATGAGDAAVAGFLASLLRGERPERCTAIMTAVGAQNLSALDAVSGLKPWHETLKEVDAGPARNPVPAGLAPLLR